MPDVAVWLMLAVPPVVMLALGLVLGGHFYASAHRSEIDSLRAALGDQLKTIGMLRQAVRKDRGLPLERPPATKEDDQESPSQILLDPARRKQQKEAREKQEKAARTDREIELLFSR